MVAKWRAIDHRAIGQYRAIDQRSKGRRHGEQGKGWEGGLEDKRCAKGGRLNKRGWSQGSHKMQQTIAVGKDKPLFMTPKDRCAFDYGGPRDNA